MDKQEVESLAKDALEHNPLSAHCERVLEKPLECTDFRAVRAYCMCFAWDLMEREKRTKLPMREAWEQVRRVCRRE